MSFSSVYPQIYNQKIDLLLIDASKTWYRNGKYGGFRDLTGVALRNLHIGSIVIFCDFINWVLTTLRQNQ